jgi:hypothetical protein
MNFRASGPTPGLDRDLPGSNFVDPSDSSFGAGVGLDSGDVSAAPGAVPRGGYPSSAAKPGGQDMFRPDLFATPSVGDIATKPPAAEAAKPGLSATGGSDEGVLDYVVWKDDVGVLRSICAGTDGGAATVDFRLKLLTGKFVTVQFEGKRITLRAIQQQVERLETALPALHWLETDTLRLTFGEALALRSAADQCDLVKAMPQFFDSKEEPPDFPVKDLWEQVRKFRRELLQQRDAGVGSLPPHEQAATCLPSAVLGALDQWGTLETERRRLANLTGDTRQPVFQAPPVPLERPVTVVEAGERPTIRRLDDALQAQLQVQQGNAKDASSCDFSSQRQCMSANSQCVLQ